MNEEIKNQAESLLGRIPAEHRNRGTAAAVGAGVGGILGSVLRGPVGAAIGASLGAVVGVAVGEKSKPGSGR